ncbi:hypothetical protein M0R45_018758 [Rubus argutus]|uniref:Uncharacterized protein n=1 Tax=Rubus argutus TaxID=59490 RepID=A0AAW1X5Z7_RUBAR
MKMRLIEQIHLVALSFNWNFNNTLAILMSAILGFLLQWSGALALGATSAVTHVVLGQFKTCQFAGMSIYTYLNLKQQSSRTSPRQASTLSKSKLSKENGNHDGNFGAESV